MLIFLYHLRLKQELYENFEKITNNNEKSLLAIYEHIKRMETESSKHDRHLSREVKNTSRPILVIGKIHKELEKSQKMRNRIIENQNFRDKLIARINTEPKPKVYSVEPI